MKKNNVILQISDMHLSERRAYNYPNWTAALAYVNQAQPDLVVCTGDIVLDDPDVEEDHAFAAAQLRLLSADSVALPGNHDIGDSKPKPYMGQGVSEQRLARYRKHFGPDRWTRRLGDWRLVGINSLILDSGLPDEEEQHMWLREVVSDDLGRPTVLFLHKPLFIDRFDEDVLSHWCVTPNGRRHLWSILHRANVQLVVCGHTHYYRTLTVDGITMVWAPAIGHIDFDDPIAFDAFRTTGLVRYELGSNGVEFGLVLPDGLRTWDAAGLIRASGSMRNAPLLGPEAAVRRVTGHSTQDAVPLT